MAGERINRGVPPASSRLPVLGHDTTVPVRAGTLVAVVVAIVGGAVWATQFYAGQVALREEVASIKAQLIEIRADLRGLMPKKP
jgi:hypothetical protein